MFVDQSDRSAMEAAIDAGVSAYVVDGLKKERIRPILDMAVSRFNAYSRMVRELEDARSELEGRKIIDRAKAILMKSKGISEDEAQCPAAPHGHEPEPQDQRAGAKPCPRCRTVGVKP